MERRDFLQQIGALGAAAALPAAALARAYDPAANFELKVADVPFRRNAAGRQLWARVYQPQADGKNAGPFPLVLDLHGGAWTRKDRSAEEPMDRAIASSGAVVVAIDMTLSGEAPYPANVQDANYGVRWLKSKARDWNADGSSVGIYGSSTGGHIAILLAMRPRDARYNAIPLEGAPGIDASVAYVAARSPITDPYARWQQAEKMKRENLIKASKSYFQPWESIHEANPQQILERGEPVALRPLLIMQGELDDNVLPSMQETFVKAYRAAGGSVDYHVFEGSDHLWVAQPGPQTEKAREMVKAFIARQLTSQS
jgi:acetyl esterase/lipase